MSYKDLDDKEYDDRRVTKEQLSRQKENLVMLYLMKFSKITAKALSMHLLKLQKEKRIDKRITLSYSVVSSVLRLFKRRNRATSVDHVWSYKP